MYRLRSEEEALGARPSEPALRALMASFEATADALVALGEAEKARDLASSSPLLQRPEVAAVLRSAPPIPTDADGPPPLFGTATFTEVTTTTIATTTTTTQKRLELAPYATAPADEESPRSRRRSPTGCKTPGFVDSTASTSPAGALPSHPPAAAVATLPAPAPPPPPRHHVRRPPPPPSRAGARGFSLKLDSSAVLRELNSMTKIKVPAPAAPAAPGSGDDIVLMPAPRRRRGARGGRAGVAAAGGGRAHQLRLPEEEAMAAGDGIPSATKIRGPWVSLNANRMKFVGDLFGAGAVDTLFGEENMVGETTAAPMSWDASGVPSPGAVFPSPGPSPVVVTKRQRGRDTDLPPRRVAGLRARGLGLPGTRRRGARTGRPTVAPRPCAPVPARKGRSRTNK